MIDSILLTVIFVWIGFLVCLFLVYFPCKTTWYDKKHYIPYTRIVEIQSLGTEDWSECEEPDISEILNLPW